MSIRELQPQSFRSYAWIVALSVLACLSVSLSAQGATKIWTGAASTDFEAGGNWSPAGTPGATDDVVFTGVPTANQPALTVSRAINSVSFSTPTGGWTFGGSAFILTVNSAAGIGTNGQTNGLNTVSCGVAVGAAQTWTVGTGGNLTLTGVLSGTQALTVGRFGNNGALNIRAGAAAQVNTYSGPLTVAFGTLTYGGGANAFAGDGALGGDVSVNSGATLSSYANNVVVNTSIFTINGTWDMAGASETLGALAGSGSIVNLGPTTLTAGGGNTFSGAIGGTGAITLTGGTQILGGSVANTFTGGTSITGGTLQLNNTLALQNSTVTVNVAGGLTFGANGTFVVGGLAGTGDISLLNGATPLTLQVGSQLNNSSNTYSGVLSGASANFTKFGTGTLTLSGANTFTGTTSIVGGTLTVTGSLNGTAGTPLTFLGTGTFNCQEPAGSNQGMGALTFSAGAGTVQSTFAATSAALTFSSLAPRASGATGNLVISGGANGTTNSIIVQGTAAGFINQGIFFNGNDFAYMNAAGTFVRAPVYGTDPGFTTSAAAATVTGAHVQITGAITAQTTTTYTTLKIAGAFAFTGVANNTVTVSGIIKTGTAAAMATGSLTAPAGGELVIRAPVAADALTIGLPIGATGVNRVTTSGAGPITMSAAAVNTHTGGTNVNQGTLIVAADTNFGSVAAANPVTINGGTLQPSVSFTPSANHGFVIGAGGGAINGNGLGFTAPAANWLTGTGNLTINGNASTNSVLTSGFAQSFSGNIVIASARIVTSGTGITSPFGTGDITVGAGTSSLYVASNNQTFLNRLWITGNGGEVRGVVRLQNATTVLSGPIVLTGNASFSSEAASLQNISGQITGLFTLTLGGQTGSNAGGIYQLLNAANAHSGTTVGSGITQITADSNLGTANGTLTLNNGTLRPGVAGASTSALRPVTLTNTGSVDSNGALGMSLDGVIGGAGGLTKIGTGVVTLNGANTYTGATNVNAGTLLVNGIETNNSAHSVNTGGTLGGSGAIAGPVTVQAGGTLAPGSVVGGISTRDTLTFSNAGAALTLNGGAIVSFQISSAQPTTGPLAGSNDFLNVTNPAATVLISNIFFQVSGSGSFGAGRYRVFNNANAAGTIITGASSVTVSSPPGFFALLDPATNTPNVDLVVNPQAGLKVWSGAAFPDTKWSTPGNWAGNAAPAAGDTIVFPTPPTTNKTANADAALASTSFNAIIFQDSGYVVTGVPLSLTTTTTTDPVSFQSAGTAGTASVSNNIALPNSGVLTTTAGNTLTLSGAVSGAAGVSSGGPGTVILSGANTYTGGTSVFGGTLRMASSSALGSTANPLTLGAGTLDLNGNNLTVARLSSLAGTTLTDTSTTGTTLVTVTANGNGRTIAGAILNGANGRVLALDLTGSGDTTINGANTYSGGTTLTTMRVLLGANSSALGTGPVTIKGTSGTADGAEVYITGGTFANSFFINGDGGGTSADTELRGAIRADGGTISGPITLQSNASIGAYVGGTATITGAISGAFVLSINKSSANTPNIVSLNNGNSTYSGGTTLANGTLLVFGSSIPSAFGATTITSGIVGTGTLTLAGGLLQSGATTAPGPVIANPVMATGNASLSNNNNGAAGTSGDLTLNGPISGSGTLNVNSAISNSLWLGGDVSAFTGTINFTVNAAGLNFRLQGNATDFSKATFNLSGATTGREIIWNGVNGATIQMGALSGTGGLIGGATGNTCTYQIGALNTSTTYAGLITTPAAGGTISVTKVGTGTLTFTGANTYIGATTVLGGTLLVNGVETGASPHNVVAGTLGGTGTIAGSVAINGNGILSPGAGASGQLTINNAGGLFLSPGSVLNFDLSTAPTVTFTAGNDFVNLSNAASALVLGGPQVNVNATGAFAAGTYRLINNAFATGTTVQGLGPVTLSGAAATGLAGFLDATTNAPHLNLVVYSTATPNKVWSGADSANNTNWSNGLNWVGGVAPVAGDVLEFRQTATSFNATNDLALVFNQILFTGTGTSNYALGGSQVTLSNSASTISVQSTGSTLVHSLNMPISAPSGASISATSGNTLNLIGTISGVGVSFGGAGTVKLFGANTYTGGSAIVSGTVQLNHASALGAAANALGLSAGTLDLNGVNASVGSLSSGAGSTITDNTAAAGTTTLTVTANGNGRTLAGVIKNGSGGRVLALNLTGNGDTSITGANTYTGGTTLTTARILVVANPSAFGTGAVTINGTSGSATGAQVFAFGGTYANSFLINGDGGGSIGDTTLRGALRLDNFATITGPITLQSAASIGGSFVGTANAANANSVGIIAGPITGNFDLTLTKVGAGTIRCGAANVLPSGALAGNLTVTTGTLDLNGFSQTINGLNGAGVIDNVVAGGTPVLTFGSNNATGSFTGIIRNTTGSLALLKTGTGTQTNTGVNTFTGNTVISQGTIQSGGTGTVSTASPGIVTLGDANTGANAVAWLWQGGGLPPTNIVVASQGTGLATIGTFSAGTSTVCSGTLTLNRAVTFNDGTNDRSSFTGKISGNPGTITIAGTGATQKRITFDNANNNFVGNLVIPVGTVFQSNSVTALPYTTTVNNNGIFQLNAAGIHYIDALNGTGGVSIIAAGVQTLTLGSNGGSGTFAGIISNNTAALSITKGGMGTQTLSGANTYTGTTTVSSGTLNLDYTTLDTGKIADTSILSLTGGTLKLTGGTHIEIVASTSVGAGASSVVQANGTATLQMGIITRAAGGTIDFAAPNIATTSTLNLTSGILGSWATVGSLNFATNSLNAANGPITAFNAYVDVAARGDSIIDNVSTNVRINTAGTTGNDVLPFNPTLLNSLLQNTTTASTIDTAGKVIRTTGITIGSGQEALTIGAAPGDGLLTSLTSGGELVLTNLNPAKPLTVNASITNFNTTTTTLASVLTKSGPGTVVLAGSNFYTGQTNINAGTLTLNGPFNGNTGLGNMIVSNAGTNATLNINANMLINQLQVGTQPGSAGAVNMSAGTVFAGGDNEVTFTFGTATGGYGMLNMTGGTINTTRFQFAGNLTGTTAGVGVGLLSGGTVNCSTYIILSRHGLSNSTLTVLPGATILHNTASQTIGLGWDGSGRAELNVAGGFIDNSGQNVTFGGGGAFNGTAIANLNSGTLKTNAFVKNAAVPIGYYLNFNGGTLQSNSSTAAFIPALNGAYVNGAFGTFSGGAVIDTNRFNDTVVGNLIAPTGQGVRSIAVTSPGSGYIGAPYVSISDSGAGFGATAYATVDTNVASPTYGQLTSIVVTNPGNNYTGATITLFGGGGSGAVATATQGANVSGGLTKNGLGTLTLVGVNTYTGTTTVNAGTLLVSGTGTLAAASGLSVNGGGQFSYLPTALGTLNVASLNLASSSSIGLAFGDTINSTGAATAAGSVYLNLSGAFAFGTQYTLLTAASGLSAGNYVVVNPTFNFTLAVTDTAVRITPTTPAANPLAISYWKGGLSGNPGVWAATTGTASNWASDAAGTVTPVVPVASTNVTFSATGATNQGNMALGTNLSVNSLTINGNTATPNETNPLTLNNASGSTLTVGAGGITVNAGSGAVTLNAPLAGAGGVTMNANSVLTLSGANSYTGATAINGGTLKAGAANTFSPASALNLADAAGVSLDLNGFNNVIGTLSGGGSSGGNINLGAATLNINQPQVNSIYNGVISGTGNLMRTGVGQTVLGGSASNTYTGTTIVDCSTAGSDFNGLYLNKSGGAFAIIGPVQFGTRSLTQANLKCMQSNQFGPGVVVNFTNLAGNWGRFDLLATTQSLAGIVAGTPTILTGAVVQNTGLSDTVTTGTGTLNLTGSGNYLYHGYVRDMDNSALTHKLFLNKTGTGTQTFIGPQIIYSGTTTVSAGLLRLQDTVNFVSPINNLATVEFNAANTLDIKNGAAFSGPGTWNKTGSGLMRIMGNAPAVQVNFSGQFNVKEGTLQNDFNAVNWSACTGSLDVSSGAIFDLYADPVFVDKLTGQGIVRNNFGNVNPGTFSGSSPSTERLTVGVANGGSTFGGTIADNASGGPAGTGAGGGLLELFKVGSGTFTLSGNNIYKGITVVNAGTLALANGALGTTVVTVNAGATLQGRGTIGGGVTIAAGGTLSPGAATPSLTADKLVLAGTPAPLTLNPTAAVNFRLAGAPSLVPTVGNDFIDCTNVGGTVQLGNGTFNITGSGAFAVGTYRLINNAGLMAGSPTLGSLALPAGFSAYLDTTTNANQLNLVVYTTTAPPTTNKVWSGANSAVNTNWSNPLNWVGGVAPVTDDVLEFPQTAAAFTATNDLNLLTFKQIVFTGTGTSNYTLNGAEVTLSNTAASVAMQTASTGRTHTLNLPFNLPAGITFSATAGNTLVVTGAVSSTTGLTVTGNGTVRLSGANFYLGTTAVLSGTLQMNNASALGSVSNSLIVAGGTLDLNGNDLTVSTLASSAGSAITDNTAAAGTTKLAVIFNGTGRVIAGVIRNGAGGRVLALDLSGLGDTTITGTNTYSGGTTLTQARIITNNGSAFGTGSVTIAGTSGVSNGAQVFANGGGTYANNFLINGDGGGSVNDSALRGALRLDNGAAITGTVTLQSDASISSASVAAGVVSGKITGSFNLSINKVGVATSTIVLSNATNDYSGSTSIGAGTLQLAGGANRLPVGTTVVFLGAATLDLNNQAQTVAGVTINATVSATLANGTLNVGGGTIAFLGNVGGTSSLTGGTIAINGATIDASEALISGIVRTVNSKITGTGGLTLRGSGDISETGGGNNSTFTLTNLTNEFTGGVTITAGLVNITPGNAVLGDAANVVTLSGGGVLNTATLTLPASRSFVLGGGADGYFRQYGAATLTIPGVISGTGNLRKTDGGILFLSGANTYSGNTVVGNGQLTLAGTGTINGAALSVGRSPGGATFRLQDTAMASFSGFVFVGEVAAGNPGTITQAGGTMTFTTEDDDTIRIGHWPTETSTYNLQGGTLNSTGVDWVVGWDGNGVLNVSGGTANLSGIRMGNTATVGNHNGNGTITVSGGRLNIDSGGISAGGTGAKTVSLTGGTLGASASWTGSLPIAITNSPTFDIFGGNATLSGVVSGSGNLIKSSSGALVLTAANTYSGATTVNGGTLRLSSGTAQILNSTAITVNAGGTLDLDNTGLATNPNSLPDAGTVTLAGGTLIMSAASSLNRTETILALATAPNTSSTIVLNANGASNSQLSVATGTPVFAGSLNLIRNNAGAVLTGTANLLYANQFYNIPTAIPNAFVNSQPAGYDTAQGLIQLTGQTYYTVAAGSWNTPATWSPAGTPGATDTVVIRHAVTLDAAQTANSVVFDGAAGATTGIVNPGAGTPSLAVVTGSITVTGANTGTINAVIKDAAVVLPLNKQGTGILALTGVNTYSGGTTISAGPSLPGTGSTGNAAILVNNVSALGTGPINIGSFPNLRAIEFNLTTGTVANAINLPTAGTGQVGIQGRDNSSNFTLSGKISGGYAGAGGAVGLILFVDFGNSQSSGIIRFTNATNDFIAAIDMNRGILGITADSVLGNAANIVVLDQTSPVGALRFDAPNINVAHSIALISQSQLNTNGNNGTVSGVILGPDNLNKTGAGTLTLTAANTYTGATTVTAGTLQVGTGSIGSIQAVSPVSIAASAVLAVNLPNTSTFGNSVANAGNLNILSVGTNTLSGVISGAGTFTLASGGTSILTGTNTFSGSVNVSGGSTVSISSGDNLGNASASNTLILAGGRLQSTGAAVDLGALRGIQLGNGGGDFDVSSTNALTIPGQINGAGSINDNLNKLGTGSLYLNNANNTYIGGTVVSAGVLGGTGKLTASRITVQAAGTVQPGTAAAPGVFSAARADFSGGGTLKVRITTASAHDDLVVLPAGLLTMGGTSKLVMDLAGLLATDPQIEHIVGETPAWSSGSGFATKTVVNNTSGLGATVSYKIVNPTTRQILVAIGSAVVTPVTLDAFAAKAQGAGVLLEWTAVSEYRNAGFDLYRRSLSAAEWTRVNPAMIPGRITNPDEKKYSYYDWAAAGVFEYKVESIDVMGKREAHGKLSAAVNMDFASVDGVAAEGIGAATESIYVAASMRYSAAMQAAHPLDSNVSVKSGQEASAQDDGFANARSVQPGRPHHNGDVFVRALDSLPDAEIGASAQPAGMDALAGVRAVSGSRVRASSYSAAKVVYSANGVTLIPQASMPNGYDLKYVSVQREGRALTALAVTADGLLVYAPGYQDDYTDKDALFLRKTSAPTAAGQLTAAAGLFASQQPVNLSTRATTTAAYHDVYFDFEMRPYNFAPWFSSKYLMNGTAQDFTLNLPHATTGAAGLSVNVWSLTESEDVSPDHALQLVVNGQWVGQAVWDGGGKFMQLMFSVPSGVLKAGDNTVKLVTPTIAGQESQTAFLHSMTAAYTRTLDGSEPFEIVNGATTQMYEVANVPAGGAWVVDARYPDRAALVAAATQVQPDGSLRLRFVATGGGSGRFIVTPVGKENRPLGVSARQIRAARLNGTYLATGPAQFGSGVRKLLTARSKEGVRGAFIDQEQLFDYYNYGRFGPNGIQNAVRALRPAYLLLAGRTTYDYLNYSGANVDPLCPTFLVSTSFWAQTTSDSAFGDLGRGYPEVAVGRLPVNDTAELAGAVNHILNYQGIAPSGMRLHAVADKPDPAAGDFGAQLDSALKANHPDIGWEENYLARTYQTAPEVTASMTAAANGGADLILYSGHGNAVRLGAETPDILNTESVKSWTGNTIFIQATCTANWMAKNEAGYKSIAIQALTQPQGGIAASIGTSTYMNPEAALSFANQLLVNTNGNGMRWGTALLKTQQWAARQQGGGTSWLLDLSKTQQLFGDPAMPVYMKRGNAGGQKPTQSVPGTTGTPGTPATPGTF